MIAALEHVKIGNTLLGKYSGGNPFHDGMNVDGRWVDDPVQFGPVPDGVFLIAPL